MNSLLTLLLTLLLFQFYFVSSSSVHNCTSNADCVMTCLGNTCQNKTLLCPVSTTNQTYICRVECLNISSCIGSTVIASTGVSKLTFYASSNFSAIAATIITNGTSNVEIICSGPGSCTYTNIRIYQAKVVEMTVNNTIGSFITSGAWDANVAITDSQVVSVNCITASSCMAIGLYLFGNDNVSIRCEGYQAIVMGLIMVQSKQLFLYAGEGNAEEYYFTMFFNKLYLSHIDNLTMQISSGGSFYEYYSLEYIKTFLLLTPENGITDAQWLAVNISTYAINSWNVTSIWIVEGSMLGSQYICPDFKDCNIRIDAVQYYTVVRCPMKWMSSPNGSTCNFYCTAYQGCGLVHLMAESTPILNVFMYSSENSGFLVNANNVFVTSNESTIANIYCNYVYGSGCNHVHMYTYGYTNVKLFCSRDSCNNSYFFFTNFTNNVTIVADDEALTSSQVIVSNGPYVLVTTDDVPQSDYGLYNSTFYFDNINHVDLQCRRTGDCMSTKINTSHVNNMLVECGKNDVSGIGYNCEKARFYVDSMTNFNITCLGNNSCEQTFIQYNAQNTQNSSCVIDCQLNPNDLNIVNCMNMTIDVNYSAQGYQDIDLLCQSKGQYRACKGVNVLCGDDTITCQCPVVYNYTTGSWSCQGKCGTSTCYSNDSGNKSTAPIIIIIIIVCIVISMVIATIVIVYCCKRCKKTTNEGSNDQLLGINKIDEGKNDQTA